ncbi:MAG: BspA family leucine-rich repeat surface protein [Bacteroidaceae bacterium]|nr:BspA family leucine-rich repeat surface protein [Bacteroidaceae bacterium]
MKKTLFVTKLKVAALALLCSLNVWSQTDVTATYIVNPEPTENTDGWTISEPVTQFNSGLRVAEFWNKSGASISQTISLPAGQYSLSAVAFTRTGMEAKLFAGDNYQTIVTVPSSEVNDLTQASLWFDDGHGANELMFTMSTAGDVTIGLQADEYYGDHWMVWRNFKLNVFSSNVVTMNVTVSGGKVTFNDNSAINSSHTFFVQTGTDAVLTFTPEVGYKLTSVILNDTEDLTSQVVNNTLTLSNVTSSIQLNVTFTKIVNAAELGDALITSIDQLSSPYMESSEGSWEGMIDEDANTFWHSVWSNGSVTPGIHYFQVEMPSGNYDAICFKYVRRNVSNDHTIQWSVYGTDNPDAEKEECTLITNVQTPFSNTTETLISPPFNPGSWTYLRFYSEEQYPNSRGYFHVAEFQLYTTAALTSWETAYLDLEKTYKQYYGSVFSVLSDQNAVDAFHSALQSSLMLLNDPDNVTEGELVASRENLINAYQAALTSIQSVRQLEYETTVEGTTYSLYMQVEDMNDAKVNADGWAFYRSKLFLDVTKDNQTNSYLIDDQLYMHIEVFDRVQTPMLFDLDSRQLYIFALSKDGDGSYSMAGYAYHTDLDNIEFEKEMVFNYANCGWWPNFIGVRGGQPVLSHFSFAGYYSMISYREGSGYWSNQYIPDNVLPDEYQRFWQQQEHVIITGGNWVGDSQYEAALAAIPDGAQYRIFTQHNGTEEGTTKYYLKDDGSLTASASEAHLFTFNQIEGDNFYLSPGWNLDVPFTNPLMSMANEVTGDIVPQGHIRVADGYYRENWEGQLWYKKGNRYAVRSTNSLSSMWGANTFWAALDNNADNLPEADYALAPAYVWQLEGDDIVVDPEPYAVLKDSILTFYYDDMKEARGGMSVGPFGAAEYRGWHNNVSSITRVVFKSSFANNTTLTSTASWFYGMTNLTTIEGIHYLNTSNVTNMRDMFSSCSSLTSLDVSGFNTQNVTDMYGMFYNCSGLTSLNLSNFNTSNVLNMQSMFNHCTSLTSLDLSSFDTHNVTDMSAMFTICWSLSSLDISSFNTQSVTNMESMFYGCGDLTSLDVSSFNTQIVTNMAHMFAGCSGLTSLDLSGFNTQNVMNMSQMFFSCYGLTTIYAGSDWSTGAVTDEGEYMFSGCTKLVGGNGTVYDENHQDASYAHIDGGPSNPGYFTERTGLFDGLVAYFPFNGDTKDASGYGNHVASQTGEITQVTGADGTANGAYHFDGGRMMVPNSKSLLFTDSCTFSAYVRATDYESTYGGAPQCVMAKSYDQVGLVLLEFEIHEDSIFSVMSAHGNNPTSEYIAPRNDRGLPGNFLGKWVHFAHVIKGDKAYFYTNGQLIYERSVSTPDLFNDVNQEDLYIGMNSVDWFGMRGDLDEVRIYNRALSEAEIQELAQYGEGPEVNEPEPYALFSENNTKLTFYYDNQKKARGGMSIGPFGAAEYRGWHNNVSSITHVVFDSSFANNTTVTSTASWFYGMTNLTTIDGIHYLNTSNVTNMRDMFSSCSSLTSLDVSGFNTQNVTDMYGMFYNCSSLKSLDLSHFDTSNVLNMQSMFNNCTSLTSLDLSSFDTHNVTNMFAMFSICWSLSSLDISSFNTQSVTNMESMFQSCGDLTSLDVSSFNTQIVTNMAHMFAGCSGLTSLDLSGFNTQNVMNMSQMFFSCYGLTTIYAGSDWSIGTVTDEGEYMFANCGSLVGGHGTTYDGNHTDASYAHLDGGPSNPGYFTKVGSFGVTLTAQAHGQVTSGDTQVRESSQVFYFDEASSMTLTITPDLGYVIDKVMKEGSMDLTSQVTNGALTVAVSAATSLTVSFKHDTSFTLGDANADKDIDVADVVVTARHVVGNTPARFVTWLADVTEDGDISVADMVGIVNIITGPESNETKGMWNADIVNDVLTGTLTNDVVSISLDGASRYSAFQMAFTLPEGLSADEVHVSTRAAQGHSLLTGMLADGRLMVLVYAADNSPLGISGEVLRLQLPTAMDADLVADKIEFVTAGGQVKRFAPLIISQPTGIADMQNVTLSGTVYDVSGRPVNNGKRLKKGLYINNGRKTLVK